MIQYRGPRSVHFIALLLAMRLSGCVSPDKGPEREERVRSEVAPATDREQDAAIEAQAKAAEERSLRALFPEIQGQITRASIARAIEAERARAPAPELSPADATRDRPSRARSAIKRGDYAGAWLLLGEILVDEQGRRARELLESGDSRGALAILDRAVEIAPHDARVRCLRGEAGLRVGVEDGERALLEAALSDYSAAAREEPSAEAWMGASRSARALRDVDLALEYARRGMQSWKADPRAPELSVPPERTLAEATFEAYLIARQAAPTGVIVSSGGVPGGADAGPGPSGPASAELTRARECFAECRTALEALIARLPKYPWAWQRQATLFESEGLLAEAQAIALRGLNEAPSDEELHQRLAKISTALGGRTALLAVYADFKARHPEVALAEWYPAVAHFEAAVEGLLAQGRDSNPGTPQKSDREAHLGAVRALFLNAEQGFARCRARDAQYADPCRAYELLCRDGAGWCAYHAGDLEAAQKAFLSMEDLSPGGLAAELEQKIPSGITGLHWVGGAFAARAQSENSLSSLEDLERAGKIYDFLHEYQPADPNWANDSGFFNRDTAVALERKAQALADQGKIDEANRLLDRARELMDKSFRAYVDAARLAPEDARIQNDTGLILTYYLQRDVAQALAYLTRATELGEKQVPELKGRLEEPGLSSEERDRRKKALEFVESALGDAYQNLGVLALTLNGDAKSARAWFEKSLATGQDPREEISGKGGYLDQCAEALAGRRNAVVTDKTRWGAPKSSKVDKKSN